MDETQILAGLNEIFHDIFDDDSIVLSRETTADDIEEWDSFNHVNVIVATEQKYGVRFQTAEIEGLKNVGELVDTIAAKMK